MYKEIFDEYRKNLQLLRAISNDDQKSVISARIEKVSHLISLNDDTGKTNFEMLLEPYVNFFKCFAWELIEPRDARDNYKKHEPDFNDWKWRKGHKARASN